MSIYWLTPKMFTTAWRWPGQAPRSTIPFGSPGGRQRLKCFSQYVLPPRVTLAGSWIGIRNSDEDVGVPGGDFLVVPQCHSPWALWITLLHAFITKALGHLDMLLQNTARRFCFTQDVTVTCLLHILVFIEVRNTFLFRLHFWRIVKMPCLPPPPSFPLCFP